MKKTLALFIFVSIFNFSLCKNTTVNFSPEVRGLSLKYILIDSLYEIYEVNISNSLSEKDYRYDYISRKHYTWLCDTYNDFPKEMKKYLKTLMKRVPWALMNVTSELDDDADLNEIINSLNSSPKLNFDENFKAQNKFWLNSYYENHLKDYIRKSESEFVEKSKILNRVLQGKEADLLGFMEKESGIRFSKRYKPVFYYTFRYIGSMGFTHDNEIVSLLFRNTTKFKGLFSSSFHEYSHFLFKTFSDSKEFRAITEKIRDSDKKMLQCWSNSFSYSYTFNGWCEENLIEGFAHYLNYKYYNIDTSKPTYIYDLEFYRFLRKRNFDPAQESLKDFCIKFYEKEIH